MSDFDYQTATLHDIIVEMMLNDGPDDTIYDIADRIVLRFATTATPQPEAAGEAGLREAAQEMYAAWRDAETDLVTNRMDLAAKALATALAAPALPEPER